MINQTRRWNNFLFVNLRNWAILQKTWGRLVFTFSQIWTSHSHTFHSLQPILNCNIPKFKFKYQQFKTGETKLVYELVFLLFSNKRVSFFGTPGSFEKIVTESIQAHTIFARRTVRFFDNCSNLQQCCRLLKMVTFCLLFCVYQSFPAKH